MTTWHSLVEYVRQNYKIADEEPDRFTLIFNLGDGRSQMVFLWRQALMAGDEEWLQIESPCAEVGKVSVERILEELGNSVCGGAVIIGGHILVRSSMPLADMNIDEFERPLTLVTTTADRLERQLFGGDKY